MRRGYGALRRYRESKPEADYFLTCNLAKRGTGFDEPVLTGQVVQQWRKLELAGFWTVRTAVIMPDHIHLLIRLGDPGSLAECMRLFKGRLAAALRPHNLKWQAGFYEHRLREAEDMLPVFLYIYLNPYRAKLLSSGQKWTGYYCSAEDWSWFGAMTDKEWPQPEWLR